MHFPNPFCTVCGNALWFAPSHFVPLFIIRSSSTQVRSCTYTHTHTPPTHLSHLWWVVLFVDSTWVGGFWSVYGVEWDVQSIRTQCSHLLLGTTRGTCASLSQLHCFLILFFSMHSPLIHLHSRALSLSLSLLLVLSHHRKYHDIITHQKFWRSLMIWVENVRILSCRSVLCPVSCVLSSPSQKMVEFNLTLIYTTPLLSRCLGD
jgi:hypothetical protein